MSKIRVFDSVSAILTGGVILVSLSGCSHEKHSSSYISESNVSVASTFVDSVTTVPTTSTFTTSTSTTTSTSSTSSTTSTVSESTVVSSMNNVISTDYTTTAAYTDDDNLVLDYFDDMGKNVIDDLDSESFLDKGKMYFVYCVDFLFYDGEIKGVKFSDLSLMAKQQLLRDISVVDDFICSKFPNYKETISEGAGNIYNKASELIKEGANNINDFSREKLGEENYSKMEMYKDLFIEQTVDDWKDFTDILGKGKSILDDWYINFKGQN